MTAEDAMNCCGDEVPDTKQPPEGISPLPEARDNGVGRSTKKAAVLRMLVAVLSGAELLAMFLQFMKLDRIKLKYGLVE